MITRRRLIAASAAVGSVLLARPAISRAWLIGKPASAGYTTAAARFDGATILELASLTATDSPFLSFSYWYNSAQDIQNGGSPLWVSNPIPFAAGDMNNFIAYNDLRDRPFTGTIIWGATATPSLSAWHNVLVCCDMNHAAGLRVYQSWVDDVNITDTAFVDSGPALSLTPNTYPFSIAGDTTGNINTVDIADFWWSTGQFIDFSVEANRRKFISAGLKPVDLGTDGATPTGTKPTFFLRLAPAALASTFANDETSNGNNFSITGTGLTVAPTSPSD